MARNINLSDDELLALVTQRLSPEALANAAKTAKSKQAAEAAERAWKVKDEVEKHVMEVYGLTLQQIFTARDPNAPKDAKKGPKTYKHPDGRTYVSGKGRPPAWTKEAGVSIH
jgi:DNA-binding protein H-NS